MRLLAAASCLGLALLVAGCGGGDEGTSAAAGDFGAYPADESLDEEGVVRAYVDALDTRDGERFCSVVAPWISGRFDIQGTEPEAPLSRPLPCPDFVSGFIGYIEDCCPPEFHGAEVVDVGELERRGDVVGVPITVELELEQDGREYTEPLEDIVWITRDADAWRVATLSSVAAQASIVLESEPDFDVPPDPAAEREAFAAEVESALRRREEYEASYREVSGEASCPDAARYADTGRDVEEYRHPAPPPPTPQLPAADLRAVHVHAADGRICALFELSGDIQTGTTFDFVIESPDFDWGVSGFSQGFEVDLRTDGRARVTSGRNDERRAISVPAEVGRDGPRLALLVDAESFSTGEPFPGSVTPSSPLDRFNLRADVTVEVSEERLLHDDLGPGPPEGTQRYPYPPS